MGWKTPHERHEHLVDIGNTNGHLGIESWGGKHLMNIFKFDLF